MADDLFLRLVPILNVADLDTERRFYELLGLRVTYEGPEYPGFLAMGDERAVEFGIQSAPGTLDGLTWQFQVSDVDEMRRRLDSAGIAYESRTHSPAPGWRYRTLSLRSPNGYRVLLEGTNEWT
ncbi:VOC family protein [Hamadaea tsunoensis]|uniref:VOC family protein n=1 Tax=Hamadaea tsunoensis TaxID=53368 RepID=UPI0003FF45BD|nr:VOC family protein [Hamadaea tsunoensis]